jgi:hypothetical protein
MQAKALQEIGPDYILDLATCVSSCCSSPGEFSARRVRRDGSQPDLQRLSASRSCTGSSISMAT